MPSSPTHRPATRSDVARAAGVSTAVVSYVVNDGPRPVAEQTRARVRRVIAELDYRPNPSARALKTGRTGITGVIVPDVANPFFAELVGSLQSVAQRHGLVTVVGSHSENPVHEAQLVTELIDRGVDGFVMATARLSTAAQWREEIARPIVLVDCADPVPGFITVGPAARDGARRAVAHLLEHGHHQVALAHGGHPDAVAQHRRWGWQDALRSMGLPDGPVEYGPYTRAGGLSIGRRLLQRRPLPTAVFACCDLQAFGLLRAFGEAGVRVPDDIAMVSFDGTAHTAFSWPTVTTVRQPVEAMGEAAVAAVLEPKSQSPTPHRLLPMDLMVRRSCGCRPAVGSPTEDVR
ncbi:MAG TPA: LacI family DNA-binding transcriptional regulator [Microlunatus sp.]